MKSVLTALLLAWASSATAQQPPGLLEEKPPTTPAIREISPGILQVGGVRLEKATRRATFPAKLNMNEGPLEYLLVTTMGKTHESVLKTEIEPHHLQVAMLLLGAKGMQAAPLTNAPSGGPITQGPGAERNPPLPGEPVLIEVAWIHDGKALKKRIEELAFNKRAKERMSPGPFTFTGSRVWQGRFIAQTEGSLIAIVTDADAVFNNPRPHRDEDDTWIVRKQDVPPLDTPVEVSITLLPPAKAPAGQGK